MIMFLSLFVFFFCSIMFPFTAISQNQLENKVVEIEWNRKPSQVHRGDKKSVRKKSNTRQLG